MNQGEGPLGPAVIDTANGFAYFASITNPAIIVKVRLSDFTRVGALTLNPGEGSTNNGAMVIDTIGGFLYLGTGASQGVIVRVRLSDFARIDALTLPPGEGNFTSAVIDTVNGFAYFGANAQVTFTGSIVRIRLSDFTLAGALSVAPMYFVDLLSAVIDSASGFAYFGTAAVFSPGGPVPVPAVIVKVRLSDFTLAASLTLAPLESRAFGALIDTAGGFAYFGSGTSPLVATSQGFIVKIRLSDFSRVTALNLDPGQVAIANIIDPNAGMAYFGTVNVGTITSPGVIVTVRLSDFSRIDSLALNAGQSMLSGAVIDVNAGFAYFGTLTSPGIIVKVSTGAPLPNFQLSVTPDSRTVALTGSATFTVSITPIGGFSSSVFLSFSGPCPPSVATCAFRPNQISPGQTSTLTIRTVSTAPTGPFSLTITGSSDTLTRTRTVTIDIEKMVGIKNIVTLYDFRVQSTGGCINPSRFSCFSIQQNFRINAPSQTPSGYTFWAQNVIFIEKDVLGGTRALPVFAVFNPSDLVHPIVCKAGSVVTRSVCVFLGVSSWPIFDLPVAFTLTSQILNDELTMKNDLNSFTITLDVGSYINMDEQSPLPSPPELVIVGERSSVLGTDEAIFDAPTSGQVLSFVQFMSQPFTESIIQTEIGTFSLLQTSETSLNLEWTITGVNSASFSFASKSSDQGVRYRPSG